MFGKIFESTFTGSMMGAGPVVFAVWSYAIAHAKPATTDNGETGVVELNPKLLAATIGASPEQVREALDYLQAPDPESRSRKAEGRRLLHAGAFLYELPTFTDYRRKANPDDRKAAVRKRVAEHRRRKKQSVTPPVTQSNRSNAKQKQKQKQKTEMDGRMDDGAASLEKGVPGPVGTRTGDPPAGQEGREGPQDVPESTISVGACPNTDVWPNARHGPYRAPHRCPYQTTVKQDHHYLCSCCAACEDACRRDIP